MYGIELIGLKTPQVFHQLIQDNIEYLKNVYLAKHRESKFSAIAMFHSGRICEKVFAYVLPFHYTTRTNDSGPGDLARLMTLSEDFNFSIEIDFELFVIGEYFDEYEKRRGIPGTLWLEPFGNYLADIRGEPEESLTKKTDLYTPSIKWMDFCNSIDSEEPDLWDAVKKQPRGEDWIYWEQK